MTKKTLHHLGQLIMQVHLTPLQRYKLIEALPYLSSPKLREVYQQLKNIQKSEKTWVKKVQKMKADVDSGKVKIKG